MKSARVQVHCFDSYGVLISSEVYRAFEEELEKLKTDIINDLPKFIVPKMTELSFRIKRLDEEKINTQPYGLSLDREFLLDSMIQGIPQRYILEGIDKVMAL